MLRRVHVISSDSKVWHDRL